MKSIVVSNADLIGDRDELVELSINLRVMVNRSRYIREYDVDSSKSNVSIMRALKEDILEDIFIRLETGDVMLENGIITDIESES